jgi:hypothetical protein
LAQLVEHLFHAAIHVVAALISPTVASGQDYTFGDWARDHGYSPGDVIPLNTWMSFGMDMSPKSKASMVP